MHTQSHTTQQYFHCYATANDKCHYFNGIQNLMRISRFYSGVDKVSLFIAISQVHNVNFVDKLFVKTIKKIFRKNAIITIEEIFFKPNAGRDFSSYHLLLLKVKRIANEQDYILFQNRSAFGPFSDNWYRKYITQFEKFNNVALCGSTINFMDHPHRSLNNNVAHVQTYALLSKICFMNLLTDDFPGASEVDRTKIILNGEIGLSQFFLNKNYKITCIEWPELAIDKNSTAPVNVDIKSNVSENHAFYHRRYFKKNRSNRIIWSYYFYFLFKCIWPT